MLQMYNIICTKIWKWRLALFGHILHLNPDTPSQQAIKYYVTLHKHQVQKLS